MLRVHIPQKIKKAEIVAVKEGSTTDLIIFHQTGQPANPGTWKYKRFEDENAVKDFISGTGPTAISGNEVEIVTDDNSYLVFYKN